MGLQAFTPGDRSWVVLGAWTPAHQARDPTGVCPAMSQVQGAQTTRLSAGDTVDDSRSATCRRLLG